MNVNERKKPILFAEEVSLLEIFWVSLVALITSSHAYFVTLRNGFKGDGSMVLDMVAVAVGLLVFTTIFFGVQCFRTKVNTSVLLVLLLMFVLILGSFIGVLANIIDGGFSIDASVITIILVYVWFIQKCRTLFFGTYTFHLSRKRPKKYALLVIVLGTLILISVLSKGFVDNSFLFNFSIFGLILGDLVSRYLLHDGDEYEVPMSIQRFFEGHLRR